MMFIVYRKTTGRIEGLRSDSRAHSEIEMLIAVFGEGAEPGTLSIGGRRFGAFETELESLPPGKRVDPVARVLIDDPDYVPPPPEIPVSDPSAPKPAPTA